MSISTRYVHTIRCSVPSKCSSKNSLYSIEDKAFMPFLIAQIPTKENSQWTLHLEEADGIIFTLSSGQELSA